MRFLIILLSMIVIGVLYAFPIPKIPFEEIYRNVDSKTKASLRAFRSENPTKRLEVSGTSWEYLCLGEGEQTILFLHGMAGAYDIWWQQMMALKHRYRVLSLTYPQLDTLEALSHGIMAILEKEKAGTVNLVGSSLGGYLAQYLVAKNPRRFRTAIYANTFPPNDIIADKNRVIGRLLPFLPAWAVMLNLRKKTEQAIYPASGNSEIVRAYMLEQSYGMMSKAQFVARYHCVIDYFTPPAQKDRGISVLIIEVDNDPLVDNSLREMLKQTYPLAKVCTLHDVGHFPYLNEPELYTHHIKQFLSDKVKIKN
jgi:maspardin